tara:strand:+ start:582 stop:1136 length:555 start_codon:yes stop_codon:yes gene_type:complete
MARSSKYNKNLQKVQDMLDGNHNRKLQVGYGEKAEEVKKVGDKWTDSEGYKWEQKKGFKVKLSNTPARGIAPRCSSCEKYCIEPWDKSTQPRYGRCYTCQGEWEEDLKWNKKNRIGLKGNKWQHWVRLQQLLDMDAIEKDMEGKIDEISRIRNAEDNPFDKSVVNALANSNVDTSMQVNKKLTS